MINGKITPPIIDKLPEFRFPEIKVRNLSDGTLVYLVDDQSLPVVSVKLLMKTGAVSESIPGLCSMTAQLLTKGTEKRNAVQIAEEVEFMGASLNCNGAWDESSLSIHCLADHLESMLEIMSDCFNNSTLSNEELERTRKKNISSILQDQSDPGYLSSISFILKYFENHPYGHPQAGTPDTILRITREDCFEWYNRMKNSTIVFYVAGNFDTERLLDNLEKLFIKTSVPTDLINTNVNIPLEIKRKKISIVALNKPESQQTSLKIAMPMAGRSHPDYPLIQLVNTIYGGFFLSRLNSLLREKLGYTYGVGSSINSRLYGSYFSVSTKINDTATKDSIEKSLDELRRISLYPIEKEEHSRAIQYILGSFVRNIETPQQIMNFLYIINMFDLNADYYNEYYRRLSNSGLDEILAVQKKHFIPDKITISVVGNLRNFIDDIKLMGNIEEYESIEELYKRYL
jgi:zinc protease